VGLESEIGGGKWWEGKGLFLEKVVTEKGLLRFAASDGRGVDMADRRGIE